MFIDYLTLLLVNMAAGFALLAWFVATDFGTPDGRRWVPAFAVVGLVAVVFGTHLAMTWPLPGVYNSPFGELSVLFGALFLGLALALAFGWSLLPLAGYAFFAGLAAIVFGARIFDLHYTMNPLVTGASFILSGVAGVLAPLMFTRWMGHRLVRYLAALVLLGAAGLWALTGYMSIWAHLGGDNFIKWLPLTMR